MQCSVTLERDVNSGKIVKMVNNVKNTSKKDYNLDNIIDQQCTRYQDIQEQSSTLRAGMPTCSVDQTEAVRRYYAAFPALKKGQESPLQYYLPPPAWCRKSDADQKVNMQSELSMISKDWNSKKKFSTGKERRNSYHGQRKSNKKRCNSYSRSFESKESLPEWVTHEGVWDMDTQDPVKEFIRAIALDEGYGTCENTVTDELKEIAQVKFRLNENMVPAWDDSLDLDTEWVINDDLNPRVRTPMEDEMYAKFEAKFDRSIEALWKDQNTPDDEYQDLPIDFQDLLSSPSDNLFADPSVEKSMMSLTESIWSNASERESPSRLAEALHDRLRPLQLAEAEAEAGAAAVADPADSFAVYSEVDIYDAAENVACTMRSLTAINHSRDRSGFVEVPPRAPPRPASDLLTSARTHFRPIERDAGARYRDGDTFDIRGDLDPVPFRRSDSGGVYIEGCEERYLEYRGDKTIDYGRLRLTDAQRCPDLDDDAFKLRFPLRQRDAAVQTDRAELWCEDCGGSAKKKRPSAMETIWTCDVIACDSCPVTEPVPRPALPPDELTRDWEELLSDISAAHATPAAPEAADRKRRHSAALRCAAACSHPHARFLACCALLDRPLTR
ncbi:uncharacterized protein LOC133522675 isoform X2 [Cydia pomonella]|uniref:uncharacterized protein LOC133522675 isoform X2 n=1 Tax=Cydia pomonella TaxID=82600 RepID=UPI002ADD9A76|nr:uncharacterized protein LOC133522675 isoform X2 [Cydia pomonella]